MKLTGFAEGLAEIGFALFPRQRSSLWDMVIKSNAYLRNLHAVHDLYFTQAKITLTATL